MIMKVCRKCGDTKPLEDFNKDKHRPDGRAVYCRPCNKAVQAYQYYKTHGSTHPLKKLKSLSAQERFFLSFRMHESGCWLWLGKPTGSNGYGRIKANGKNTPAHRYSWQLHSGIVPQGLHVLHRCDTPLCVNPGHLFLGTNQDNSDDKIAKGRQARGPRLSAILRATAPRGEKNANCKLTDRAVLEIKNSKDTGPTLAKKYGVSATLINLIKKGRARQWLTKKET